MPQPESSATLTLMTKEPGRDSRAQDQTSKLPVRRQSENPCPSEVHLADVNKHVMRNGLSNTILIQPETKQKPQLDSGKSGSPRKELREEAIGLGPGEGE